MPASDLQIASDLIARVAKLQPSTRLLRTKIINRVTKSGKLPSTKSIGYWRNLAAAMQMAAAGKCAPFMDAAKRGDSAALAYIKRVLNALRHGTLGAPEESERKPRVGRVRSLSRLREGWQQTVYDHLSPKWQPLFAIIALTGCRPAELMGMEIRPTDQEGVLTFKIYGRKVTEKAGQAWRELDIDVRGSDYGRALLAELDGMGNAGVEVEMTETPQAITKAITRAAQRAKIIPLHQSVPAYACRNAMASGMKAEGKSLVEVAAALGHSTDECQKFYGRACAGHKGGGGRVLDVRTARPVKETARSLGYQHAPSLGISVTR